MEENNDYTVALNDDYACLSFSAPRPALSSAIHNGGICYADAALILRVKKNFHGRYSSFDDPAMTMDKYCRQAGLKGTTIGMMTSASMSSFRKFAKKEGGISVSACLTAGLSNARCAGDRADAGTHEYRMKPGTINIILMTNVIMSAATMAEAIMMVTEAKVAALTALGEKSPVSGKPITGTGTDATAIISGQGPEKARYCGKHTLLGEMMASVVIEALHDSLSSSSKNIS